MDNLKTLKRLDKGGSSDKKVAIQEFGDMKNIRMYMLWLMLDKEVKKEFRQKAAIAGIELVRYGYPINSIASRFSACGYFKEEKKSKTDPFTYYNHLGDIPIKKSFWQKLKELVGGERQ